MKFGNFTSNRSHIPQRGFIRSGINMPFTSFQNLRVGGGLFDEQILQGQQFRDLYMYRGLPMVNYQNSRYKYQAIEQPTKEQFLQFQKLIQAEDWDGIRYWHHQTTPWLNQESVEKCISLYKQQKENCKDLKIEDDEQTKQ